MTDNAPTPPISNSFEDIVESGLSRRTVLAGGAASAVGAFLFGGRGSVFSPTAAGAASAAAAPAPKFSFTPIAVSTADQVLVPTGYNAQVLYRWGDPAVPGGPAFKDDATNTAADQARQAGMGHDGIYFFPLPGDVDNDDRYTLSERGLLVMNHEFVENFLLHADGDPSSTLERVRKSQNAHGVSVIEVQMRNGRWQVVQGRFNRRITATTPMAVSGPAAGHPLLRTNADPDGRTIHGTVNNCAAGYTPWLTYLTCEENFNGYFGTATPSAITPAMTAYGINASGNGLGWWKQDTRFDVASEPNEVNRFGWVVEISPYLKGARAVKRTALGRLKHENAFFAEADDGRAVFYTGDDERGQFIYKYVSARPWAEMMRDGVSPLDQGTLYVARFDAGSETGDGRGVGEWRPLVHGSGPLTGPTFPDQATVLVHTRQAAAALGATKMDRPEWITVDPKTGDVYCALTNNRDRGSASQPVDDANPRANNTWGHIIRWTEAGNDHGATTFTWDLFVLAGNPANPAHGTTGDIDAFGSPDGLAFDRDGRLWIQTDGTQPVACNNQMLVGDPATETVRRFLVGPKGCEITGITFTPDQRNVFVNIQHPGEGGTVANPRAVSNWPDFRADGRPRDATIVIRRNDGGIIGT